MKISCLKLILILQTSPSFVFLFLKLLFVLNFINTIKMRKLLFPFSICLIFLGDPILAQTDHDVNSTPTYAEQMPYFPGCEDLKNGSEEKQQCSNENLVGFIADYLEYPEKAQLLGIEGTVYVSFVVDEEGKTDQAQIARDIGGGCGEEALRIVKNMPRWEPARNAGKPTKVKLLLPVRFSLKGAQEDLTEGFSFNWGNLKGNSVSKNQLLENFENELVIRDETGDKLEITELNLLYKRKNKTREALSRGALTPEMHHLVKKVKPGGELVILATVQKGGQFVEVEKVFKIEGR